MRPILFLLSPQLAEFMFRYLCLLLSFLFLLTKDGWDAIDCDWKWRLIASPDAPADFRSLEKRQAANELLFFHVYHGSWIN